MKRLFIVGLFCGAFLALRFWGESPVAESADAESARGQGGVTVSGNGDVNADNGLDLSDAIYLLTHLFQGGPAPEPCPPAAGGAGGGGGDEGGGGGGVGLGLPNTGATFCWDTRTVPCREQPGAIEGVHAGDCEDGIDNDGDGRTDCDPLFKDVDCDVFGGGQAGCFNERDAPGQGTHDNCSDGVDDDGDGFTDCKDPDCYFYPNLSGCDEPMEELCADGEDNDSDGLTDCADPDCAGVGIDGVQISCTGGEPCPGQDAFYATGCPEEDRFGVRNVGDEETVMDRCTGLMWQREMVDFSGDGLFQAGVIGDRTHSWCEALRYCENLDYAGFSDWRLPNVRELESLANRSGPMNPAFGAEGQGHFPYYWSSTPSVYNGVNGVDALSQTAPYPPIDGLHVPGAWIVDFASTATGGVAEGVGDYGATGFGMAFPWADGGNLIRAVRDVGGAGAQAGAGGGVVSGNGDVNADSGLDLSDAIYLLTHLFQGGPPPEPCPGAPQIETTCDDGVDNDLDTFTDCDDPDCAGLDGCPEAETDCTNGEDDDEDGDIDCDDSDCSDDLSCPETCDDAEDNDADGDIDCSDSECAGETHCGTTALGQLPGTGVTQCYDDEGKPIACANNVDCPGQDGDYLAGCPLTGAARFTDHGDGTVTDHCTNLMWQQGTADVSDDGMITNADKRAWCDALTYCEGLTFPVPGAGHTDWRMPNVREFFSIVDFSQLNPALSNFFTATPDGEREHWTSTSGASTKGDCEWIMFFIDGRLSTVCPSSGTEVFSFSYLRAVRDAP